MLAGVEIHHDDGNVCHGTTTTRGWQVRVVARTSVLQLMQANVPRRVGSAGRPLVDWARTRRVQIEMRSLTERADHDDRI
jgi:hypothetical protein